MNERCSVSNNVIADLVVRNATIYPDVSKPEESAEAIAVKDGKVLRIGSDEQISQLIGNTTTELTVRDGATIIPGFIESHMHAFALGETLEFLHFDGLTSIVEIQQKLKERAKQIKDTTKWIRGSGWDQGIFQEARYPSRQDLDAVAPENPVVLLRACRHVSVANTKALELAGIDRDTQDPDGGSIDHDENGEPTGVLRENAVLLVRDVIPKGDAEERADLIQKAQTLLAAKGITSIQTNDKEQLDAYMVLKKRKALLCRVYWIPDIDELEEMERLGLHTGHGDEDFKVGAIKLFADGSLGGETAALMEPYSHAPNNEGMLIYNDGAMEGLLINAVNSGFHAWIHAIGDRAAAISIDAMAMSVSHDALSSAPLEDGATKLTEGQRQARTKIMADPRHVLVHCQVLNPSLMKRMAEENIVAAIQPVFIMTDKRWTDRYLGSERAKHAYAWRSIMDHGVICCGGSDAPIEPVDPILGIYAAVTRCDLSGQPSGGWHPAEKLTVAEALTLFTKNAAYAAYEEDYKGQLKPGMLADFVVLDRDPYQIETMELKDIKVLLTVKGGAQTYNAPFYGHD